MEAHRVEIAHNAGGLVAHDAALAAVHQQGCRAATGVTRAALLVYLPVGGAGTHQGLILSWCHKPMCAYPEVLLLYVLRY